MNIRDLVWDIQKLVWNVLEEVLYIPKLVRNVRFVVLYVRKIVADMKGRFANRAFNVLQVPKLLFQADTGVAHGNIDDIQVEAGKDLLGDLVGYGQATNNQREHKEVGCT